MPWRKNDLGMPPKRRRITNPMLTEAASAAVFLMRKKPNLGEDRLFLTLKRLKPHIGDSDLVVGITRAKGALFKPEYLTSELKQEIDEWDRLE